MESRKTILLVEDEELVRRYLVQLLEESSWLVRAARSGSEALDELGKNRYDVVLCDLELGTGISGVDVMDRMPPISRETPFVILTAYGTVERCRDAMHRGASDFLEKPVSQAELFSTLNRVTHLSVPSGDMVSTERTLGPETAGHRHVRRALRLVERGFRDPDFSVEALAKAAGMTPDHLARLFRSQLGRKPLEQIHQTRIRAAEPLLSNAALSIYEVAVECGYRNTSEFDGWFARFMQLTPTEWRERHLRRD